MRASGVASPIRRRPEWTEMTEPILAPTPSLTANSQTGSFSTGRAVSARTAITGYAGSNELAGSAGRAVAICH